MRGTTLLAAFCLFRLAAAPAALGANLVSNAGFDVDLTDWFAEFTAEWSSDDHAGSQSSGSAHVTGPGGPAVRLDHNCFPVAAETTYDASVWMRLSLVGSQTGRLTLLTYSSTNCSDGFLGAQHATPDASQTGAWEFLESQVTTPATARSGIVKCEFFGDTGVDANCDAVFLPEIANGSRWALVSLALLAITRRRAARVEGRRSAR